MHALLSIALNAARDAASALAHQSDRLDRIKIIEDSNHRFLTSADQDSEKTILYHLQKAYPEHSFSSRISGDLPGKDKSTVWLIDPLVGNRNFIRGVPRYGVSIACQVDNKLRHSVLIDPLLNEEFTSSRGGGAHLNGRRIRVSDRKALPGGLVSLDFPLRSELNSRVPDLIHRLAKTGADVRINGCSALDVVYVAAGRIEGGCGVYDGVLSLAAASLILQESGGLISDSSGNPELDQAIDIVFGNPKCFKELLRLGKFAND